MSHHKHNSRRVKSHAEEFVGSLSVSQRNSLKVIFLQEHACRDLRHALAVDQHKHVSEAEHRTGLARAGRTVELFRSHVVAANIQIK